MTRSTRVVGGRRQQRVAAGQMSRRRSSGRYSGVLDAQVGRRAALRRLQAARLRRLAAAAARVGGRGRRQRRHRRPVSAVRRDRVGRRQSSGDHRVGATVRRRAAQR